MLPLPLLALLGCLLHESMAETIDGAFLTNTIFDSRHKIAHATLAKGLQYNQALMGCAKRSVELGYTKFNVIQFEPPTAISTRTTCEFMQTNATFVESNTRTAQAVIGRCPMYYDPYNRVPKPLCTKESQFSLEHDVHGYSKGEYKHFQASTLSECTEHILKYNIMVGKSNGRPLTTFTWATGSVVDQCKGLTKDVDSANTFSQTAGLLTPWNDTSSNIVDMTCSSDHIPASLLERCKILAYPLPQQAIDPWIPALPANIRFTRTHPTTATMQYHLVAAKQYMRLDTTKLVPKMRKKQTKSLEFEADTPEAALDECGHFAAGTLHRTFELTHGATGWICTVYFGKIQDAEAVNVEDNGAWWNYVYSGSPDLGGSGST